MASPNSTCKSRREELNTGDRAEKISSSRSILRSLGQGPNCPHPRWRVKSGAKPIGRENGTRKNIKKETINKEINKDKNYKGIIDISCILETILPIIFVISETSRVKKKSVYYMHNHVFYAVSTHEFFYTIGLRFNNLHPSSTFSLHRSHITDHRSQFFFYERTKRQSQ